MYSLYFITLQRSGTRPVTKPLRSIRPEHRGTFHTQFWLGTIYIYMCDIIVSQYIVYDKIVFHSHPSVALRLEQLRTRRFAWRLGHSDSTCDDFAVAVLRALGNIWKQGHLRFRWKFPKNCMSFADQTAWACENTDMVCASRSWLHRSKVTSLTASHADWRKPPEALGNHRKSFAPVSEASCRWAPSTLFLLRVI